MALGKILVVDDEVYILHILDFSLGAEGFEVITANNGELAIEKAKQEKPNLVVLDLIHVRFGTAIPPLVRARDGITENVRHTLGT